VNLWKPFKKTETSDKYAAFRNYLYGTFLPQGVLFRDLGNDIQHQDVGHILENVVYLELYRKGYQIWIGKFNEYEVDFIVKNKDNKFEYYQVTWSMANPETMEREVRALKAIRDNYPKIILSTDTLTAEIDGIEHINVVDWLLNN
jgi:predicted AAA+ superfamily ATPase